MWRENSIATAEVGNSVSLLGNAVSSLLEWGGDWGRGGSKEVLEGGPEAREDGLAGSAKNVDCIP